MCKWGWRGKIGGSVVSSNLYQSGITLRDGVFGPGIEIHLKYDRYFLWPGDTMIDSSIDTQMVKRSMWYGMEEQWLKLMKAALLGPAAFRNRWENGHTFTETHIHMHAPPPNDRHWHISVELWAISFQRLPLEDFSISVCYKEQDWRLWRLENHHWRDPVTSIS